MSFRKLNKLLLETTKISVLNESTQEYFQIISLFTSQSIIKSIVKITNNGNQIIVILRKLDLI